jgi:hypothetical protein
LLFCVANAIGVLSCNDDTNNSQISLGKNSVSIVAGFSDAVTILSDKGEYAAISDDETIATAKVEQNTILISTYKIGATIIRLKQNGGYRSSHYSSNRFISNETGSG